MMINEARLGYCVVYALKCTLVQYLLGTLLLSFLDWKIFETLNVIAWVNVYGLHCTLIRYLLGTKILSLLLY